MCWRRLESPPRGEGSSTIFASTYTLRPSTATRGRLCGSRVQRPFAGGAFCMGWSVRGSVFPYKVGHPDSPTNRAARNLGSDGPPPPPPGAPPVRAWLPPRLGLGGGACPRLGRPQRREGVPVTSTAGHGRMSGGYLDLPGGRAAPHPWRYIYIQSRAPGSGSGRW